MTKRKYRKIPADQLRKMIEDGVIHEEIAKTFDCTLGCVYVNVRKLGLKRRVPRYNWPEIQEKHDAGMTRLDLMKLYGFSEPAWTHAQKMGKIKARSMIIPMSEMLKKNTDWDIGNLKRRLVKEGVLEYKCNTCGINEWRGQRIGLQLNHKDGDNHNNEMENIEFLCPNCHSQTPTHMGANALKTIFKKVKEGKNPINAHRIEGKEIVLKGPFKKQPVVAVGERAPLFPGPRPPEFKQKDGTWTSDPLPPLRFTDEEVLRIRERSKTESIKSLASEFGYSYGGMWLLVRGITWFKVKQPEEAGQDGGGGAGPVSV